VHVVIVGARISGASLAIDLARRTHEVTLVDRATFPSDTLSTHLLQVSGARCLQRLGVLAQVEATGAPYLQAMSVDYDGTDLSGIVMPREGYPPGGVSVRRDVLDMILVDAAAAAGASVHQATTVARLRRAPATGRVCGVVLRQGERTREVRADLVVGADGRQSRVAAEVGSRFYSIAPNERFTYWADYEGVRPERLASVHHYRHGANLVLGFRSDGGIFTVMVAPDLEHFPRFRTSVAESFDAAVAGCEPMRRVLGDARRVTRPVGTTYMPGYFRESAGPGWVLIGDAGHFKDPTLGQGISDALRQSERLAARLDVAAAGAEAVDDVTRRWWRWRDRDACAMYWFSSDFARAGELTLLERSLLRQISRGTTVRQRFVDDVLSHRRSPYEVITPGVVLKAAWPVLREGGPPARQLLRELRTRARDEVVRQYRNRRRCYGSLPRTSRRQDELSWSAEGISAPRRPAAAG
jgi:2-polyprenyl-6-methoxyphenol hydroxylase-like FAD-dependent oxidoreductase